MFITNKEVALMDLIQIAKTRYATKKFDSSKKISNEDFEQIKGLLQFSPSSVNSQPWHFIIAQTETGKKRLSMAAHGQYGANEAKILDASHVILFCAKTDVTDAYLQKVTDQEDKDGRFPKQEAKELALKVRMFYADLHRKEFDDVSCWTKNQVYMNWGTILFAAGVLGIDAVPIEGVDLDVLNEEFALLEKGFMAIGILALGYHHQEDFNASLPKSRLSQEEIFTFLD